MEHQLITGHLPGGLGLRVRVFFHRLSHNSGSVLQGHRNGVLGPSGDGSQILDAASEEAARLLVQGLLEGGFHCLVIHRGVAARDGKFLPLAHKGYGELRKPVRQLGFEGIQGLFLGLTAQVDPGDGRIGQESAAARGGAQNEVAANQDDDHRQCHNEGDLTALGLFGLSGSLARCLCHIRSLQLV